MNEITAITRNELNNNADSLKNGGFRREYISSASSSDISEDVEISSVQDPINEPKQDNPDDEDERDIRRFRSMSDGAPILSPDPFEVFPSLPNSVLEKLGLLGDHPRDRLSDEDLEHKFVSLSLAFSTDAATIKNRSERQRRSRDQTETNLNMEIDRLIDKANKLQPLCIDAETTELLTGLLAQVDIIIKAAAHAAISAERFGAVQHEERLSESVQLMITYVHNLKEQREAAKRQLQYTKRVLQDTNPTEMTTIRQRASHSHISSPRAITRRRASIATITQPSPESPVKNSLETRRMTRRTSELSIRGSLLMRPSRGRLELSMLKISEGVPENSIPEPENDEDSYSNQSNDETNDTFEPPSRKTSQIIEEPTPLTLKQRLIHRMKRFGRYTEIGINKWLTDAGSNEIFCFCALMCFSLGIITLCNILVELEYAKHGGPGFFWNFSLLSNSDTL